MPLPSLLALALALATAPRPATRRHHRPVPGQGALMRVGVREAAARFRGFMEPRYRALVDRMRL